MFYCRSCGVGKGWPVDNYHSMSEGRCEICGMSGGCFDVPSRALPDPPKNTPNIMDAPLEAAIRAWVATEPGDRKGVLKTILPVLLTAMIHNEVEAERIRALAQVQVNSDG